MGNMHKLSPEKVANFVHIARTARLVRRRADEKGRGLQILDLASVDVVAVVALVGALGGVVVARFAVGPGDVFSHKGADVLAGSAAVQAGAGEPTVFGELDNQDRVAEQIGVAVFINLNMGLGVRHAGEFLDSHFCFPLSFLSVCIITHRTGFVKPFF